MINPSQTCTFTISDAMVHVWCADKRIVTSDEINDYRAYLTPAELQKAQRFIQPIHQNQSILARGMLRELLARYLNQSPANVSLTQNPYGKPILLEPDYSFNLSHSGDWIVFAFATQGQIGVDVECELDKGDYLCLADHFATKQELHALHQVAPDEVQAHFYRLWTAKEAVIKGLGKGFYADTRQFSVTCSPQQPYQVTSESLLNSWYLQAFTPEEGYAACLASDFEPSSIQYYSFDEISQK